MFNSITHGIGTLLSIAALVLLVVFAAIKGNVWHVVSFSIFGSSLVLLYLSSTLYHSFTREKLKNLFVRFDHAAIFLLIAGTYTPFVLTTIRGALGWTLFGIIWGLAITGMVIRSIYLTRFRKLMVGIYLAMGWMFLLAIGPIVRNLPASSIAFLFVGGACYSIGVIFYSWRGLKYGHGIWHLFVLAGSIMHFFSVLYSLN
ncbi:hemolysin D [Draconibacterium sediminis]|uniref:Hemolysin D n=1 Tax=Draconibacterium sediminis TaxID=1544798 RepID=A0A0D8JH48_9BACT|nr:hemolysin D [Draconibacterium sediminis]